MPRFKFDKLVRDKIVAHQLASGAKPEYHLLNPEEHKAALVQKLVEEAHEVLTAKPDEVAAEIADVQQALDDLAEQYRISRQQIAAAQKDKNAKNGAFKKGLFVESVEVDEDNSWTARYRSHPDRYPELPA